MANHYATESLRRSQRALELSNIAAAATLAGGGAQDHTTAAKAHDDAEHAHQVAAEYLTTWSRDFRGTVVAQYLKTAAAEHRYAQRNEANAAAEHREIIERLACAARYGVTVAQQSDKALTALNAAVARVEADAAA